MHRQEDPSLGFIPRHIFEAMKAAPFGTERIFREHIAAARAVATAERARVRRDEKAALKKAQRAQIEGRA